MRDNDREFTIHRIDDQNWQWQEVHATIFSHTKKVRQPGEPLQSSFKFRNPAQEQTLHFVLSAENAVISEISLEINHHQEIQLPMHLEKGQRLLYSGEDQLWVLDAQWNRLKSHKVSPSDFKVKTGNNTLGVDCRFTKDEAEAQLKLEIKTLGKTQKVSLPNT